MIYNYISCFRCAFQKVRANLPMTPNTVARSCVRRRTSTRRRASLRATPASCCHLVAPTRSRAKSRQMPEPSTSTGIRSQRLAKVWRLIYTIILLMDTVSLSPSPLSCGAYFWSLQTEFWADRFAKCLEMFHLTYFLYYKVLAL